MQYYAPKLLTQTKGSQAQHQAVSKGNCPGKIIIMQSQYLYKDFINLVVT